MNYENNLDFGDDAPSPLTGTSFGDNDGTIKLVGGLVYEDDGVTPFNVDGEQATIDTFIHRGTQTSSSLPSSEDGYQISNIEWNLKPNHPVLMKYQLITAGCQPDTAVSLTSGSISTEGVVTSMLVLLVRLFV